MPKQTFFNLPEDKRKQLLAVAMEEFASNDYNSASVSRIVEKLGIAKGSIYQYFDDKQEMFVYLVEEAGRRLLSEMTAGITGSDDADFFAQLRRQMSDTIRVNLANPQLSRLLLRSTQSPATVRDAILKRLSVVSGNHLLQLVQLGIERGDLKSNIDPVLITVMLSGLFSELGNYMMRKLNLPADNPAMLDLKAFDSIVVDQVYDSVMEVLRYGLARK